MTTRTHRNPDGTEVQVPTSARVGGSASVWGNASVGGNASVWGNASVGGNASVWGNASVGGNASVWGNASVGGNASVWGNASVGGNASVWGNASVGGNASVWGNASVGGNASVRSQTDVAWVDRVGSGNSMTLYRTETDGVPGWQITAGCKHFEADTVADVCELVRANVKGAQPAEWDGVAYETRKRWARQVRAALKFLAASVVEDDVEVAS